ncbi:choline transport protein [Trichodelitschia bisporula]|uniref:Choline transport protein n=1 Tax=Trichodelitschia bisporula TaxID=703511 RepID=A0A6G1HWI2_9PEZI|nr:choline transport protein [Trichodelitschia bisporula]
MSNVVEVLGGEEVNASGHKDELARQYGIWSLCGLALTIDNAWVALGGSITVSIFNGGPPGILYELLVACIYYGIVATCIAELASAIPSAGGVYHWASVTPGPKYGRALGFFTGALNFFGWMFDLASIMQIAASIAVQLYAVFHPDLEIQAWHVYVAYLLLTVVCSSFCIFYNRLIPKLQDAGLFLVIVGGIITIIVVVSMPEKHASNAFVWTDWDNQTGWSSGVAFLTGVLNGAFTIGTPDAITHMAEELPNPKRELPIAIAAQIILGCLTSFFFAIAILYGINDIDAVLNSNGAFPLAAVYSQATNSKGATFGLLLIIFFSVLICLVGTFLTVSRIWWSLARDNATPFPKFFSRVNHKLSCPIPSFILCTVFCAALGAIPLGSKTAFQDLVGSFIILTSTSYACAIAPHLFTGRKNVPFGPFRLGKWGFPIQAAAVLLIVFFNVMFCFPYAMPTSVSSMNYNSVILAGVLALTTVWWFIHGRTKYPGPKVAAPDEPEDIFQYALSRLFTDDLRNQHGEVSSILSYAPSSPSWPPIQLSLADVRSESDRARFAHYLWNASVLTAEIISGPGRQDREAKT